MSWAGTGEAYASSYADLCAGTGPRLRELAGAARGRSLLDAGAGDGRLAAAWRDAGWRVTACEPERSMREAAVRQHPDLDIVDGALPALPFADDAFDAVVANFVLNHVADPRAGAAELRRIARGVVIATTWSASPSSFWAEVTALSGLTPVAGGRLPADRDFARTAPGFDRMLRDAGWHPKVTELTWTWRPSIDALWRSVEGGVAGAGAFYAGLDGAGRVRFRRAFERLAAELSDGGAVPHTQTAAIAVERVR
ncbi:methyltransferase domain-containing protein [Microbacterium sp. ARD32]|uniref:class I SAM-dependent methyltransferase n=1 Tax=Microbacterium sp. ARD32 TaxID=2962577 RepID=UPI002881C085|nr:methyltransferase domain-containing protein [Microbacterium sp. ARD32]MDT0156998.1 methyltransferase domain-containing protein [Microbacterium sp. ARD32]